MKISLTLFPGFPVGPGGPWTPRGPYIKKVKLYGRILDQQTEQHQERWFQKWISSELYLTI
jgi:hypothetical protein